MTETEEKLRRYDKRQRGIELKKRLATLESSFRDYPNAWGRMIAAFAQYGQPGVAICIESDQFGSRELRVAKPKPDGLEHLHGHVAPMQTISAVPISCFDIGAILELVQQIEETRRELATVREFCQKVGDPLD